MYPYLCFTRLGDVDAWLSATVGQFDPYPCPGPHYGQGRDAYLFAAR